jgi:DNA-binding transcriptional regulator YbjK
VPRNDDTAPAPDPRVVRTHNDVLAAALHVLVHEGHQSVTHQHVADVAGYSTRRTTTPPVTCAPTSSPS